MVRIEVARDAVVVEGELREEACEEFARALDSLRRSKVTSAPVGSTTLPGGADNVVDPTASGPRGTVDLSSVTTAEAEPINVLFTLWLDMFRRGRAPHIYAPAYVWQMLGRAAVDRVLSKKPAALLR